MLISARLILLMLSAIIFAVGAVMWLVDAMRWAAITNMICGAVGLIVIMVFTSPATRAGWPRESDDIDELSVQRRRELVRGTSLYLRELRYRYSIRYDPVQTTGQHCFTAEVNSIRLGFVPVVIIDNTNDRQGLGFVAFVHDGKRWRGPGLPCPAGQVEAVRHAAKCVSPLSKDEETRF